MIAKYCKNSQAYHLEWYSLKQGSTQNAGFPGHFSQQYLDSRRIPFLEQHTHRLLGFWYLSLVTGHFCRKCWPVFLDRNDARSKSCTGFILINLSYTYASLKLVYVIGGFSENPYKMYALYRLSSIRWNTTFVVHLFDFLTIVCCVVTASFLSTKPIPWLYSSTTLSFKVTLPSLSVFRVATSLGRWNVDRKNTSRLSRYRTPRRPSSTRWTYSPWFIFLLTTSNGNLARFFLTVPQAGVLWRDNNLNNAGLVYQLSTKRWCPLSKMGAIKRITIWPVLPIFFCSWDSPTSTFAFPVYNSVLKR